MELVHCTCGGYGSVTRECALHPDEYANHVAELKFEHDSYAGELLAEALREPNPVAVLRRRLTVARQRIEDASTEECACEEALAEAERLLAESEEANVSPRETPRPETIALVERLIAAAGIDPARDHR